MEKTMTPYEIAFLRGLIAGEGSFQITLQNDEGMKFNVSTTPTFSMKMAEQSNILPLLQSKTGIGNVYDVEYDEENHADQESWVITKQGELDDLIKLLERDASNWNEFLLGLVAGEGSFHISLQKRKGYKFNVQTRPAFSMAMVEQSNILPLLQSKTGLGSIRERKGKENWSDSKEWRVRNQNELKKLATMIESQNDSLFWETDKGETFNEWQRARELKNEIGTSDQDAVKEIIDIAKSLNGTERGRSAQEWKEIVDNASKQ